MDKKYPNMKLLVIGAKGMLGSMLADIFNSYQPVCLDRDELDIVNAEEVMSRLRQIKPEIIINAAAYTNVDGAETNRDAAFAVNEGGVRAIATAAKELNAKLVHYSTDYVFSGTNPEGYREDDIPGPAVNVYGESKLEGENVLKEIAPRYYLIRTAWLYGPAGKNFVETILKATKTKQSLRVVADQYGCPTFTKDVALATKELIEQSYPFGIYHAVNQGVTTWYAFARRILAKSDPKVTVEPTTSAEYPLPARRPTYSVLLNTLGPKMRPWSAALDEYLSLRSRIYT